MLLKHGVGFFWYKDDRKAPRYISSVRPHILEKHWEANPWLSQKSIMYHDCDIALSKPLNMEGKLEMDKICYLSDTRTYIGPHYLDKFKNDNINIVITPLLAFDPKGYRVGYGKGFYDRFFASLHKDAKRIGISLFKPCKDIENINEHDIPLTHCVTPNKTYSFI